MRGGTIAMELMSWREVKNDPFSADTEDTFILLAPGLGSPALFTKLGVLAELTAMK